MKFVSKQVLRLTLSAVFMGGLMMFTTSSAHAKALNLICQHTERMQTALDFMVANRNKYPKSAEDKLKSDCSSLKGLELSNKRRPSADYLACANQIRRALSDCKAAFTERF